MKILSRLLVIHDEANLAINLVSIRIKNWLVFLLKRDFFNLIFVCSLKN